MKKGIRIAVLAVAASCFGPALLWGGCTVSAIGVSFGNYNPLDAAAATSTGTITVGCTENVRVTVGIGSSPNSGGFNPRQMLQNSGSALLGYNLYTTSAMAGIWGDGTRGTSTITHKVKKRRPWDALIYGRIPPAQDVSIGSYSETLIVTINF